MIPKKILSLIIILIIAAVFAYRLLDQKTTQVSYQTAQVERGMVVVALTASGQVETNNSASVTTQASGVVNKIYVQEGQTVKAGAPIAKLDLDLNSQQEAQQALASYQSAKNQLATAQSQIYTLQSQLFAANQTFMNGAVANNLVTADPNYIQEQATWLASEANYKNQQAVIAQAQTALNQAWLTYQQSSDTIYAPINGKINGLTLQIGSVIARSSSTSDSTSTATKVANIVTTAKPIVTVNLTEIDIPKVKIGNKVTLTIDALGDTTFVGKVVSIDTVGSVSSNVSSYPIMIQLEETNNDILPNMAVTANIITDSKSDVLIVPSSAVITQNGETTVRVMKDGQPQNVSVTVGLTSDETVEIVTGLSEGETIVTTVIQPTTSTQTSSTATSPFSALGGNRSFGASGGNRVMTTSVKAP